MFSLVESDVRELEGKFVEYLLTQNKPTNQILEHIFSTGGKRIRPALFLLCAKLIGYEGDFKFPIAAVCEYIHTASLLHDDVIDNSTIRRNKPTVNSVWGDETAVLAGDLIYSAACRIMVKTRNLELIDCFAECIRFMSESELFQLEMLWNKNMTFEQYERIVHGKTATLFEASCKTPALLNGNSEQVVTLLSEFGKNLGFAFQIADDCLDYDGKKEIVGKPTGSDLIEGKVTLPLIYSLSENDPELLNLVEKIIEKSEASDIERQNLVTLVKKNLGLQKSLTKAEEYSLKARKNLEELSNLLNKKDDFDKIFEALNYIALFAIKRKN
jgi:octaprenyl-diphosphate synthase